MKNIIIKIALTLILFCTIPVIKVSAATQGSDPFGFKTPQDIIEEAKSYISSDVTDYYCVTYSTSSGYTNYAVYFFRSDTANFTYGSILNDSNNGIWGRPGYASYSAQYVTSTQVKRGHSYSVFDSNNSLYLSYLIGSSISTYYNTVNLVATNATQYNVDKIVLKSDNYYSYKDNVYNMVMGVSAGPESDLVSVDNAKFYSTDLYWIDYSFQYSNSTVTYRLPSYSYARLNSQAVLTQATDNIILPLFNFYTSYTFQTWGRGIAVYIPDTPVAISDSSLVDFSTLNRLPSENVLSVNELYQALKNDYPNLTVDDCLTDITASFVTVSNQAVKYTTHFDFTSLKGSPVPDDTNSGPDQTNPYDELNNWLCSNNYYLSELVKGEPYVSNGMALKAGAVNIGGLSTISMPDFDLREEELDNNSMSFLGRLVEWWYSSPFGLIALVALTFLIIRTIIW